MAFDIGNYLDLWNILVNELVGSQILFIIIGLGIIWWVVIKYNLPFSVGMLLMFLFTSIIFAYLHIEIFLVVTITIIGIIFSIGIAKIIKR